MPMQALRSLTHTSLSDVWRLAFQCPRTLARLNAPPSLFSVEAISRLFPEVTPSSAEACRLEFLEDTRLFNELDKHMIETRRRRTFWPEWSEFLYMIVRIRKPRIVFETGVFDGRSSAVILSALSANRQGALVSVDLPATEVIEGSTDSMPDTTLPTNFQPGWAVPDYLRQRYKLVLGDSKRLLPRLFVEYPEIDIFFHDSLHTFEHQYFEYTLSWPHLSSSGLLLSDDIFWSSAFYKFSKQKHKRYVRVGDFGALRKETVMTHAGPEASETDKHPEWPIGR